MKSFKIFAIAFLAISIVACKPSSNKKEETTTVQQPAKLVTANIAIEGMTCEIGCAKTIESKIGKLEGVTESKVDFEAKKGTFTYDSNQTSEEKIISSINGLLDGKTYKAKHTESCKTEKKDCTKACAEKCGHKEGEACKANSEKACCKTEKKECSKPCAEKCNHKEGEACKAGEKPCTKVEKKECTSEDKKPCCATDKK